MRLGQWGLRVSEESYFLCLTLTISHVPEGTRYLLSCPPRYLGNDLQNVLLESLKDCSCSLGKGVNGQRSGTHQTSPHHSTSGCHCYLGGVEWVRRVSPRSRQACSDFIGMNESMTFWIKAARKVTTCLLFFPLKWEASL